MEELEKKAGRPCEVCRSMKRQEIEDMIFTNRPISQISQRYAVSSHSLYRHIRNHAAPAMQEAFRASVKMSTASLVSRIMDVADSARTIRLNASSEAIALKAGAAELQTLTVLATRMGVDGDSTAQMAEDAMLLAGVVGKLARGNAAFGERLVEHLAEAGADQMASMLSASFTE